MVCVDFSLIGHDPKVCLLLAVNDTTRRAVECVGGGSGLKNDFVDLSVGRKNNSLITCLVLSERSVNDVVKSLSTISFSKINTLYILLFSEIILSG